MTTPVVETITEVLEARLGNTTGVAEVVRIKSRESFTPKDNQIVLEQDDLEIDPELSCPGNPPKTAWVQPYNIRCHVRPSETDTTPVDKLASTFAAAAIEAIGDSSSPTWHTFGGNAILAEFEGWQRITEEEVRGWIVPLRVTFRTDETDPCTLRN